jgi:DNA modification methylase
MNIQLKNGEVINELKKLKDNSVDLVITSPPYWKGFGY